MISEYFLFSVTSVVEFASGDKGLVPCLVYAESEGGAKSAAYAYLVSGKSGYKVASVVRQYLLPSTSFIATDGVPLVPFKRI